MRRITIIIVLVILVAYIVPMSTTVSVYASENVVGVCAMLSDDYVTTYNGSLLIPDSTLLNAKFQYHYVWDINLLWSFAYISPLPINGCLKQITALCDSACGSPCSTHHKNINRNYSSVINSIPCTHDLMLTMTSAALCPSGSLGLAGVNGSYSFVTNMSSFSYKLKARIIQHEWSHNFGCSGHGEICNGLCIMKGSFDSRNPLIEENIWCGYHYYQFDRLQH